ncbi:hypothetical protein FPV67DRAFT_1452635 [Lyophyllum atratum]|nr:hypothetical protein FPV67DRAFT_1452635 [Lyophyllum atratum]
MPNRGKNRASKPNQPTANGESSSSGGTSGAPSRAAMEEAVLRRAEKRKARAAVKSAELEAEKNVGNELFKAGRYAEAVDVYQDALGMFGSKAVLYSNLAAAYLKLEDYDQAEEAATKALLSDPLMLKARYRRGLARKGMYHLKAAIADFGTVLQQDRTRTEAREQLRITQALYNEIGDGEDDSDEDDFNMNSETDYWPPYDADPLTETEPESDSSDCRHVGNNFPCRFYNHDGCSKKDNCHYSHAPDEKSVRDKLGRNVCTQFLFGVCKFGAAKCVYSHDKTYLPHGWWDNEDEVARMKLLLGHMPSDTPGPSDRREHVEYTGFARVVEETSTGQTSPLTAKQQTAEPSDRREHVHYTGFATVVEETSTGQTSPSTAKQRTATSDPFDRPFILLMALDGDPNEDYKQPTLAALQAKMEMKKAVSSNEALAYLASPNLAGVFVADAALASRKHSQVLVKMVEYARGGGSVVLGGSFSSFIRPTDMARFFADSWGVAWKSGAYHRTTFSLNPSHELAKSHPALPSSYSMKALHVQGITPGAAIYKESGASPTQSPAVQIRFGQGHMGYIGDVNWEVGSIKLLLAMLRLSTSPPLPSPTKTPSNAAKATSAKTTNQGATQTVDKNRAGPSNTPQKQVPVASSSSSQLFVLLLALDGDIVEAYKQPTLAAIKDKTPVKTATSNGDALTHLASPNLSGVFVIDAGITKRQSLPVLTKLVEYAKTGGSVIIGGSFSSFVRPTDMATFFEKSWGVKWKPGSYHRTTFFLNPVHELAKANPSLLASYSMKALHVKDTPPDVMVYKPTQQSRLESLVFSPNPVTILNESPAIRAPIGKGHLGYIGDVNWEAGSAKLVLAMLGLLDPPVVPPPQATPSASIPPFVPPAPKTTSQAPPAASVPTSKPAPSTQKPVPVDSTQPKPSAAPRATSAKPFVMLLSLDNEDCFATSHAHCLSALCDKVNTYQALTASDALSKLHLANLAGVFVTDAGIVKPEHAPVLSRLVEYVKSGGSVVVGGLFSTFVLAEDMNAFFKNTWGLPWKGGSYHLARFSLNALHRTTAMNNSSLAASYSMKALHVGGISAGDVLYFPVDDLQLLANTSMDINDHSESPAVQRRIGCGYFGYIGDVNAEPETTDVILAMLGLLDAPDGTASAKPAHVDVPKSPLNTPVPKVAVSGQKSTKAKPAGPTSRPFVMVLSFGNEIFFAGVQGDLLNLLRSKLEVLHGLSNERVIELIGSPDLVGILVTEAAVADAENGYLLGKLVDFAKAGGTVVLGGSFGANMRFDKMGPFFRESWGVPWDAGSYTSADITVNSKHHIVKMNPGMPSDFRMKALHVMGVTPETAVYLPAAGEVEGSQAPVTLAQVGKGYLGYIRDVGLQDEHSKIVLAMFGLLK